MSSSAADHAPETVPARPQTTAADIQAAHRRRMVEVGSMLSAAATAFYGVFYLATGTAWIPLVNLAAAFLFVLIGIARPVNATLRLYLAVSVGLVLFGIQLLIVADINNGITPWLLVPAVAAVIMGERWLALYSSVLAFLLPGMVAAGSVARWLVPHSTLPFPNLLMLVSVVGVLGICSAFAFVSNGTRSRLQHEVESRTKALESALAEARQSQAEALEAQRLAVAASEAKEVFFANVTHEIRTPLNGIAGSAELLALSDLDPADRELADALARSSRNLVQLVNSMLEHARLRAGNAAVDHAGVDPRRIADELRDMFARQSRARSLQLDVTAGDDVPAWVETDAIKLRQILTNLVGNALKFTEQGRVAVRFARDERPGPTGMVNLRVTVADTGIGIPEPLIEQVFEPFVQADAAINRVRGGTGLGLAIARDMARLMGGDLTVASRVGEGSTFTLILPVRELPAPEAASAATGHGIADGGGVTRVLLAEDNPLNRTVATRMLRKLGADVTVAEDGIAAVRAAAEDHFDLVLMDLQMPVMDGITAAATIRAFEAVAGTPAVRIVAMTGNDPADYADEAAEAGMDRFLVKPVDLAGLRALLQVGT
jgi:signal transduction histidine kinase